MAINLNPFKGKQSKSEKLAGLERSKAYLLEHIEWLREDYSRQPWEDREKYRNPVEVANEEIKAAQQRISEIEQEISSLK